MLLVMRDRSRAGPGGAACRCATLGRSVGHLDASLPESGEVRNCIIADREALHTRCGKRDQRDVLIRLQRGQRLWATAPPASLEPRTRRSVREPRRNACLGG